MEFSNISKLQHEFRPTILHLLNTSLPNLSGYSIRTQNILRHLKDYCSLYAMTEPRFLPNRNPDLIDNIFYYRYPPISGINYFFNPTIQKIIKKAKINNWYYQTLFKNASLVLRNFLNTYPIDIIHIHSSSFYGKYGGKVAKEYKIPFIYELRGFLEDTHVGLGILKENSFIYHRKQEKTYSILKKADVIITLGEPMKNELICHGFDKNKIIIIPNGVNTQKFKPIPPNLHLKKNLSIENDYILGYIGSIRRIEGIEILLMALKLIKKKINNIKLLLIGPYNYDYLQDLITLTEKLNIKKNILIIGKIPNSRIQEYYSILDICIIPRLNLKVNRLVTPLKPLEVMAMGKVLITSNLPALRELVKPKISGILFEAENHQDLSEKILEVLNDENKRNNLGKSARQFVEDNYDWKIIIKKYFSIYQELINKR